MHDLDQVGAAGGACQRELLAAAPPGRCRDHRVRGATARHLAGSSPPPRPAAAVILGSCRLAGVDPLEYLRDVLPRMTRKVRLVDLPELLPHRWKRRRDAVAAFCAALARLGNGG